ncbi:MAG TPA: ester cyclase [Terriglobales bacterium]|jgi:hypothetical protein|nr:ester cyclase [Terriglobales bacterium]
MAADADRLAELTNFAKRYTEAWCSRSAASVAAFFSPDGSLKVNESPVAVGPDSITEVAQSFMTAFPDLKVIMDGLELLGSGAVYRWSLIGTNIGPGGTGKRVHINGFERWTIGTDGLITESKGFFEPVEYQRQLQVGV